ncbi:hypothetical protein GCM10029964_113800 [Kibdelosporangium lantanae]
MAAGLGVLVLFIAFAPIGGGSSFYELSYGWVPAIFLLAGLLELPAILPGDEEKRKPGLLPAAVSVAGTLVFLFTTFSVGSLGAGGIMVLIFGILQTGAAVVAYLFETGMIKPPAPNPYGAMHPGAYPPPQQGFPQTGGFPAQQPQQPTTQQPGVYGGGSPGQQTQFAPQQGQFGQPGTPPGGFPGRPQD